MNKICNQCDELASSWSWLAAFSLGDLATYSRPWSYLPYWIATGLPSCSAPRDNRSLIESIICTINKGIMMH